MTTNGSRVQEAVDSTYRKLMEARKHLQEFVRENPETFNQFAALVDEFNQALAMHAGALKAGKTTSPPPDLIFTTLTTLPLPAMHKGKPSAPPLARPRRKW